MNEFSSHPETQDSPPDALQFLRDNLGGDRMVSRSELEKLSLYRGGGGEISLDDAMAELDKRARKVTRRPGNAKPERMAAAQAMLSFR